MHEGMHMHMYAQKHTVPNNHKMSIKWSEQRGRDRRKRLSKRSHAIFIWAMFCVTSLSLTAFNSHVCLILQQRASLGYSIKKNKSNRGIINKSSLWLSRAEHCCPQSEGIHSGFMDVCHSFAMLQVKEGKYTFSDFGFVVNLTVER